MLNSSTGAIEAHYEYDPYGNEVLSTGALASSNPYRFSTKYLDDEFNLYYYGFRYYDPETGRWLNRDPIEEEGGINIYAFILNNPIDKVDYLGKKDMPFIKLAIGLTANADIVSKATKYGLVIGRGTAIMFFPASGEIASFTVTAGFGKSLDEWRWPLPSDFPDAQDWERFEAGLNAGVGLGIEEAYYVGGGLADADSFEGIFHTSQGSLATVGLSGYVGDRDENGGYWVGGTVTVGPGLGAAKIDWLYKHHGLKIDLDNEQEMGPLSPAARCFLLGLRTALGYWDAYKYY